MAQLNELVVNGPSHLVNDVAIDGKASITEIVLDSTSYGTSLPSSGNTVGQLFIKIES